MKNKRKHRNIKFITREMTKNYLKSEPSYYTTRFFIESFLAIKTQILINHPLYFGLSVLDLSKTVMHEFWYDYVKSEYGENAKLCYIDKDSFIVRLKTGDIYKNIAEDVETTFVTSN